MLNLISVAIGFSCVISAFSSSQPEAYDVNDLHHRVGLGIKGPDY